MRYITLCSLIVTVMLACSPAQCGETVPFQVTVIHPWQLFPEDASVQGLRINVLYGINESVEGIDYGLVNKVTRHARGVQLGAFLLCGVNMTGDVEGLQVGGLLGGANIAGGDVTGVQLSGEIVGFNKAEGMDGLQASGFFGMNMAEDLRGVQIALIYNQAFTAQGLQVGAVNVCDQMTGVQIGLINIIKDSSVPFLPFVNARF
ncbi:MAG TPA: hypothetical protein PKM41_14070 [Deltaproteobacteria bacterium]|jgi:hypothetical protein|nr:hypothetical protein [Deltaproteobacteria bacterium]HOI08354.1 hypothetical protein [Deltaproteobacteria bacterium]